MTFIWSGRTNHFQDEDGNKDRCRQRSGWKPMRAEKVNGSLSLGLVAYVYKDKNRELRCKAWCADARQQIGLTGVVG